MMSSPLPVQATPPPLRRPQISERTGPGCASTFDVARGSDWLRLGLEVYALPAGEVRSGGGHECMCFLCCHSLRSNGLARSRSSRKYLEQDGVVPLRHERWRLGRLLTPSRGDSLDLARGAGLSPSPLRQLAKLLLDWRRLDLRKLRRLVVTKRYRMLAT